MIKTNDTSFNDAAIHLLDYVIKGVRRPSIEIVLKDSTYNDIATNFVDNIQILSAYTPLWKNKVYDYTSYVVAGDIVDHRDGTFSIYMGKKTELEAALEANAALEAENAELLFQTLTGEEFSE